MISAWMLSVLNFTFVCLAGGGGKGTWGKNGEVYEEESEDPKDPNYDSEENKVGYIFF